MLEVNGEKYYGQGDFKKYQSHYENLETNAKRSEVDEFRANKIAKQYQSRPTEEKKCPEEIINNLMDRYTQPELVNLLLDIQGIRGELRQKLFKKYMDNSRKETVCKMYLDKILYRK